MNLTASAREILKTAALLDKFHLLCKHRQEQLGEEMHRRAEAAALSEKAVRGRVQQIGEQLYLSSATRPESVSSCTPAEVFRRWSTRSSANRSNSRIWRSMRSATDCGCAEEGQIAATVKSLESARKLICQRQDQVAEQEQQRKEHLERLHKSRLSY